MVDIQWHRNDLATAAEHRPYRSPADLLQVVADYWAIHQSRITLSINCLSLFVKCSPLSPATPGWNDVTAAAFSGKPKLVDVNNINKEECDHLDRSAAG